MLAVNVNDGSSMSMEWAPPMGHRLFARITLGATTDDDWHAIPSEQAMVIPRLAKGRVPEVLGWSIGPFVVAPKIREFLETHEPGVHHFLPIQIRTERAVDGRQEHGTHWLLRAPPLIDCLNLQETVMIDDIQGRPWSRAKDERDYWGGGIPSGNEDPCVLHKEPIRGRHLWRVKGGAHRSEYACSPEFWSFFRAEKMIGWRCDKTCTVK